MENEHKATSPQPDQENLITALLTDLQSPKMDTLQIGQIEIDLTTGDVTIPDHMNATDAAKEFWTTVREVYRSHDW